MEIIEKVMIEELSISRKTNYNLKENTDMINNSQKAYKVIKKIIGDKDREHLILLTLNQKLQINGYAIVFIGSTDQIATSNFDLLKFPILTNSRNVIVGHNHPSGNVEPSNADINATEKYKKAFKTLGITLLDHIIVTDNQYYSFEENKTHTVKENTYE